MSNHEQYSFHRNSKILSATAKHHHTRKRSSLQLHVSHQNLPRIPLSQSLRSMNLHCSRALRSTIMLNTHTRPPLYRLPLHHLLALGSIPAYCMNHRADRTSQRYFLSAYINNVIHPLNGLVFLLLTSCCEEPTPHVYESNPYQSLSNISQDQFTCPVLPNDADTAFSG